MRTPSQLAPQLLKSLSGKSLTTNFQGLLNQAGAGNLQPCSCVRHKPARASDSEITFEHWEVRKRDPATELVQLIGSLKGSRRHSEEAVPGGSQSEIQGE